MGDVRFERPYSRLQQSRDRAAVLRSMAEEELVEALASASRHNDPLLANTVATEALNRIYRLRAALQNLGDGVVTLDAEGIVTYANPMATRLLGRAADDLVGHEFVRVAGLTDRRPVAVALAGGTQLGADERMTRADGMQFPVVFTAAPIYSAFDDQTMAPARAIDGVVISFRDITDRENARIFLQSTLDAVSFHIAILDERGVIRAVNRAWREFADENGMTLPDHGIGSSYLDVVERAAREGDAEAADDVVGIRSAIEGRTREYRREYPCATPTKELWFVLRASGFTGATGERYAVVSHANVTQQHELDTIGNVLRAIAESAGVATFATTLDGETLVWNERATALFGYSAQEALGRPVDRLLDGAPEQSKATIRARIDRGETVHLPRARVRGRTGDVLVDLTLAPVRGKDGRFVAISATAKPLP